MAMDADAGSDHLERIVAGLCGLSAADNGVDRVHVVCGKRPTYDELTRYRCHAAKRGLDLFVDGQGVVLVRPARPAATRERRG